MKEKSSLELFAIALYEGGYLQGNGDEINELLEHHKAMHEYEIKNAYWAGIDDHLNQNKMPNSEGYYNETFGGNNEQQ
jgi:hypothetical protein